MGNRKSFPARFPYSSSNAVTPRELGARPSSEKGSKDEKASGIFVAPGRRRRGPPGDTATSLIDELPDETLMHLLSFLFDPTDAALLLSPVAAMLVCKRWHRILEGTYRAPAVWRLGSPSLFPPPLPLSLSRADLQRCAICRPWRDKRDELAFRRVSALRSLRINAARQRKRKTHPFPPPPCSQRSPPLHPPPSPALAPTAPRLCQEKGGGEHKGWQVRRRMDRRAWQTWKRQPTLPGRRLLLRGLAKGSPARVGSLHVGQRTYLLRGVAAGEAARIWHVHVPVREPLRRSMGGQYAAGQGRMDQ